MKKISFALVGVLFSTLVFAYGTDEPGVTKSSVAVTRTAGSSLFKVFYTSYSKSDVKISILDKAGNSVFSEKIRHTDGFIRPYNFNGLKNGEYVITLQTNEGTKSELVNYDGDKIEKYINIVKLSDDGKYLLSARTEASDKINVSIYNHNNELVFLQDKSFEGEFAEVFNLKKLKAFTIEVTDSNGVLKTYKNL